MDNKTINELINFIRSIYGNSDIALHKPIFDNNEKESVLNAINSTFVSTAGESIALFENQIKDFTGSKYAIATSSGTAALHIALLSIGCNKHTEVITQSLSFVATANAISYCNSNPIFIDVDTDTMGLSPEYLDNFFKENCELREDGFCWNKNTNKIVKACVPMHTYGLMTRIEKIKKICKRYNVSIVEDAAESLGSFYNNKHSGTFGEVGAFSFNGNKIITTGAGGAIITNNSKIASLARHLSTTAKLDDGLFFNHDMLGYNYRMANINAALGIAQMKKINDFIKYKRNLATKYQDFFNGNLINFFKEIPLSKSNYWLNTILCENINQRDIILEKLNKNKIFARPSWNLLNTLPMYTNCYNDGLKNSLYLADRVVNLPSSVNL